MTRKFYRVDKFGQLSPVGDAAVDSIDDFIELALRMRAAQKDFQVVPDNDKLRERARQLEREFDELLENR